MRSNQQTIDDAKDRIDDKIHRWYAPLRQTNSATARKDPPADKGKSAVTRRRKAAGPDSLGQRGYRSWTSHRVQLLVFDSTLRQRSECLDTVRGKQEYTRTWGCTMKQKPRHWVVLVGLLGAAVTVWGVPLAGQAQSAQPVTRTEGTLASADCKALTVTLKTPTGIRAFRATRVTGVVVGEEYGLSVCALAQFVGAQAIVLSSSVDGNQVAGQVDVLAFPASGAIGPLGADSGNGNGSDSGGTHSNGSGTNNNSGNTGGGKNGGGNTGGGNTGGGNTGGGNTGGGDNGGGNKGGGDNDGGHDGGHDGGKDGGKDGGHDEGSNGSW